MIKKLTATNHLGESITIDLFDPQPSGFIVESIDGLGPANANLNFTDLATADGAITNSARIGTRNIVIKLQYYDDPASGRTIEDCRLLTYKYFPIKRDVTLTIETERRTVETTGKVESNEPDIFNEKTSCQISVVCPDPYLYRQGTIVTTFDLYEPLFEFPFENESPTEPLLEFGEYSNKLMRELYYDGDMEVGMVIKLHALGPISGFVLYNLDGQQKLSINDTKYTSITGSGIVAGDTIVINTKKREKSVTLIRNYVSKNILNAMDQPFQWFEMVKGLNTFYYTAESGYDNVELTIESRIAYDGV